MKKKAVRGDSDIKKYLPYIIIFAVVMLMEVFLFNWRFFESFEYEQTDLYEFNYGTGISIEGSNQIKIGSGDKYIEFTDIDTKINNIYIDVRDNRNDTPVTLGDGKSRSFQKAAVVISATDEANAQYYDMPERVIAEGVERTKYIRLHTLGESKSLKITFNGVDNQTLTINSVTINKPVPFSFSLIRVCFFLIVFTLAYLLRFGSELYNIKCKTGSNPQFAVTAVLIGASIILAAGMIYSNPTFINTGFSHHHQYDYLAQSFLNGHLYLDYAEPPQALIDMENPYDKKERDRVMSENNTGYKWDHAYYDGKYYVYFGVLPVLTYYLPSRALTDSEFPTYTGVLINISVFIIFSFMLLRKIVRKWFKNIPFVNFLLLGEVLAASSGIVFALRKADIYVMPITMGLMLTAMGLYFWLGAYESKKTKIQIIRLGAGSLCMALVAGCRPQLLLGSFLALPLFWKKVFKERELFSKKSLGQSLAFVLPYAVIAAAVMWYNAARFGSVFDFGANYNLTTNDMTRRGFVLGRLPLGIFAYIFQLPVTYAKFPFITGSNLSNSYMGVTVTEAMFGGIFAAQPILWLILFTRALRAELKEKGIYAFIICCIAFTFVIACADTEMGGILYRYYLDFSYFMLAAAAVIAFVLIEKHNTKQVFCVITLLCSLCMLYNSIVLIVPGDYSYESSNPNFYYSIASALCFWM
ncbi:MAG: hypothetical protein LUG24_02480 [Clostridiales bacterium]|nr:hypothetical protein [Clostridiales bacterium]